MAQIIVTINGRSFRMACDDGEEERLTGLARRFDGCIDTLRGSFGEIGDLRLTVMAGIMIMDELHDLQTAVDANAAELAELRRAAGSADENRAAEADALADRLENLAERITTLSRKVSGVSK